MARESTKTPETDTPAGDAIPEGALPGQITSPNPVEVFWEKHKIKIWIALIVCVAGYLGVMGWEYKKRLERNALWSKVTAATGLDASYQPENYNAMFGGLDSKFGQGLSEKTPQEIQESVDAMSDDAAKAIGLWFLARRHAEDGDYDAAKASLDKLAAVSPNFPGLKERPAPPIFIEIPEVKEDDPASKKLAENPPLPAAAKLSDKILAAAKRQKEFREKYPHLYEAPKPADKPTVEMVTSKGRIVIKFYPDKAPKHVEQFLKNCEEKKYDGLSFHRITRMGEGPFAQFMFEGKLAFLGDPETKQDDRTKWGQFKSEKQIEDEISGISHFPFMLAADRDTTKKGSDTQLVYFTASDAPKRDDGYVVFGRVVEGQDVITEITSEPLSSSQEAQSGSGVPATAITVESTTVTR